MHTTEFYRLNRVEVHFWRLFSVPTMRYIVFRWFQTIAASCEWCAISWHPAHHRCAFRSYSTLALFHNSRDTLKIVTVSEQQSYYFTSLLSTLWNLLQKLFAFERSNMADIYSQPGGINGIPCDSLHQTGTRLIWCAVKRRAISFILV